MSATRIGVVGAGGRMGRMLIEATLKDDHLRSMSICELRVRKRRTTL